MKLAAILLGLLLAGLVPAPGQSTPRWLPLADVLKKWEGQPIEAVQQAAEKGEPTACHYLGYAYAEGLRGAPDGAKAIVWYERGIALKYLPSASNLGLLYFRGKLVPREVSKALHYYRLAADGGFPNAQAMLGFIYEEGNGVKQDDAEALKWLQRAAEQGHAQAMVHLGRHYRLGEGVSKDLREASKWFRQAADQGEPAGILNLGWVYGYEQSDQAAALKCYREAAEKGLSEAMYELYLSYWNGKGIAKDREEGRKWLIQAAESGLAKAQYRLGDLCELDTTTFRENLPEALHWYRKAAEQEWPGGQFKLAELYLRGAVVEPDEERALDLMRAAADQDYAPAVRELALLYARGIGEPRRREEQPLNLLKRVTRLQEPGERSVSQWAYEDIVRRYQYGLGTEKDLIAAAQWYCRGANAGVWFFAPDEILENRPRPARGNSFTSTPDLRGTISLILPAKEGDEFCRVLREYARVASSQGGSMALQFGERYLAGRDAPSDPIKAWCWFNVAAAKGDGAAAQRVTAAAERLDKAQQAEAKLVLDELNEDLRKLAAAGLPSGEASTRR